MGHEGGGFFALTRRRGGGYYLDVGASQLIIDGKIKLKNDSVIKRYTPTGLEFEDGSTLDADVIMFATGFASPVVSLAKIFGEEIASRVKPVWNLNSEGELRTAWRDSGVPNFWFMMGNLAWCRFHSKHLALRKCPIGPLLEGNNAHYSRCARDRDQGAGDRCFPRECVAVCVGPTTCARELRKRSKGSKKSGNAHCILYFQFSAFTACHRCQLESESGPRMSS